MILRGTALVPIYEKQVEAADPSVVLPMEGCGGRGAEGRVRSLLDSLWSKDEDLQELLVQLRVICGNRGEVLKPVASRSSVEAIWL